ncbi:MAG: hypothetical protein KAT05_03065 [Spirochaetes bacterium]|nr:hypothetical protein [Spirochaetota bacterium]
MHEEESMEMETPVETPESPGFAFVFAIVSVLAAIVVRRR